MTSFYGTERLLLFTYGTDYQEYVKKYIVTKMKAKVNICLCNLVNIIINTVSA